ncbi:MULTISPECIES: Crp/Fnr family transcriptional regulator [Streptomyces]|uniref:Crp/Fnr family transcriptional regulator n=1 Tax=Streptomyces spinosisporus TaxID=2927582 RepID=A0ABS9XTC5_9ACTN|nr:MULTISPECIES: Crp/Fnr family transcriptional regulator [Streptomyces]MCI3245200.1 Crp/Fnr family transcriptional regulator [Streptomyces spinosisporus]WUB36333.1 Crp/Fnr family transcriptional regulator [Streptomyces sp. NBC_00588]
MKSAEGWARLREVPLFAALPDDGLRRLWQASVPRRYDRGEVLRAQGEPAEHLLVLLDGRTAASATTSGGRVVRFGAWSGPCALDKVALLDGAGHTATFTALTPCAVRAVPRPRFMALLDDSTAVRAHVLRLLAAQARAQQHRLTDAATLPCEARLAAWLLDTATADGQVALDGSQRDLADLLGVTRVTINRALSRLRHDGLIAGPEAGRIKLLAPELLALRAGRGGG